jgi:hypothetical protein
MPNFNEIYPSKSLKAEDLNRRPRVFTISDVEVKDYKDGAKLVLSFEETEKTFTLNKTNAMTIGGLYGENYPTPNSPCIRVAPELPDDAPAQRRQPVGAAVGGDEDIPF